MRSARALRGSSPLVMVPWDGGPQQVLLGTASPMALHQQSVGARGGSTSHVMLSRGVEFGISPQMGSVGPLGCRLALVQTWFRQAPGLAGVSVGLLSVEGEDARVVHLEDSYTR